MSEKAHKNCQSCGMPMKRDASGGGTNADGGKSLKYCSHCYERGAFTLPELTAAQMQARVKSKLMELKMPGFVASLLSRNVPKLERWSQG